MVWKPVGIDEDGNFPPRVKNKLDFDIAQAVGKRTLNYGAFKGEKAGPIPTLVRGTGPVFGTPAKFGAKALKASGYYQKVLDVAPDPGTTGITIEHWFNAAAVPTISTVSLCWSLGTDFWGGVKANTGLYEVRWASDPTSGLISPVSVADGQWHHIAVQASRLNGVTQFQGFWIDGVPVTGTTPVTTAKSWVPTLGLFGFDMTGFDYANTGSASMDEVCLTKGFKYTKGSSFTPPTAANTVDVNTLIVHRGESDVTAVASLGYPARPSGSAPVEFVGPVEPTAEWLDNDRWYKV